MPSHSDYQRRFRAFLRDTFVATDSPKGTGETHRWFFCLEPTQQGDAPPDDCACCVSSLDMELHIGVTHPPCGCLCHPRIAQIEDFWLATIDQLKEENEKLMEEYWVVTDTDDVIVSTERFSKLLDEHDRYKKALEEIADARVYLPEYIPSSVETHFRDLAHRALHPDQQSQ